MHSYLKSRSARRYYEIVDKIKSERLAPLFKTSRMHVQNVKAIIREKESPGTPGCPKCGGAMVLRITKKGLNAGNQFWGCKRFPTCRGLKAVN